MIYATMLFCAASLGVPCKAVDADRGFPDVDACYQQSQLIAADYLTRHPGWSLSAVSCSRHHGKKEGEDI